MVNSFSSTPKDSLPPAFHQGVEQFNNGQFYACHDTLEALWMEAEIYIKPFYQGILQIAVAFYHLGNGNWQGAAILLGEGTNRLYPFEPSYRGIDVENLIDQSQSWLVTLQKVGIEGVDALAAIVNQTDGMAEDAIADLGLKLPYIQTVS
ncbi:DUF309 domain-containing protein [Almyronema epifaneia]|uniref:DUF309 domain-containing protein n=1 Tax=Almyronema epifaneia S1 TaxID=2991925 RepID=A0ABW6IAX5_9CYAN